MASGDCEGFVLFWKIDPSTPVREIVESDEIDAIPPNKENWVRMKQSVRYKLFIVLYAAQIANFNNF